MDNIYDIEFALDKLKLKQENKEYEEVSAINDEKIYSFYLQLLSRFRHEKDYYDKKTIENMILDLHDYLKDENPYLYDELYVDKNYEKWTEQNAFKICEDYLEFANKNHDYLMNIFKNFSDLPLYDEVNTNTYVENDYDIIERFLLEVEHDLYTLFKSLIRNNIFRIKKSGYGTAYYDKAGDAHYIMVGKEHNFDNMVALVHEMGHVFRNYLMKERHNSYNYEDTLRAEISGEILELLFIKYLINNGIYEEEARNYLNKYNNELIKDAKELVDNNLGNYTNVGLGQAKYLFGRIIAYHYINNKKSYSWFTIHIHNNKLLDILNELDIDYQSISDEIKKSYCLKKQ